MALVVQNRNAHILRITFPAARNVFFCLFRCKAYNSMAGVVESLTAYPIGILASGELVSKLNSDWSSSDCTLTSLSSEHEKAARLSAPTTELQID